MQMQMNSLIHNTQTCFITTQTKTAAAAAMSHMNTVMCTLNRAQDKQTQFTCVIMKSLCYAPLQCFSHSSHKQSLRQAVLSLMTGLICSCCKMDMLESAFGAKISLPCHQLHYRLLLLHLFVCRSLFCSISELTDFI